MSTREQLLNQLERAVISASGSDIEKIVADLLGGSVTEEVAKAIASGIPAAATDALQWGQLSARAQMYTESLYATYENSVKDREIDRGATLGRRRCEEDSASCEDCVAAASDYFEPIENIPEIGSLQCLTNCRCTIETAEPGGQA